MLWPLQVWEEIGDLIFFHPIPEIGIVNVIGQ